MGHPKIWGVQVHSRERNGSEQGWVRPQPRAPPPPLGGHVTLQAAAGPRARAQSSGRRTQGPVVTWRCNRLR